MTAYIPTTADVEQYEVVSINTSHLDFFKIEGINYEIQRNICLVKWDKYFEESDDVITYFKGLQTKIKLESMLNITL